MNSDNNKILETGSSPYYLNISNTAKEYSNSELTSPNGTLLDAISKNVILEKPELTSPIVQQEYIITDAE